MSQQQLSAMTPLLGELSDVRVLLPDSAEYRSSTTPENTSVVQNPLVVARPDSAVGVATIVRAAHRHGARVSVQSTGHGAGHDLGSDIVLIDTRELRRIDIDVAQRVARIGAGMTWGQVQRSAERHGLLGLSGTSAGVGVAGYTFGGGVSWLARAHGLAAGALRSVDYVDGTGRIRHASDDAPDALDRDAIWAFRGGAPVGIATGLEMDLVSVPSLWAGLLLWPADHAAALLSAWAATVPGTPETVSSDIAMLQLPPVGAFPEELLGQPVVHLSYASVDDAEPLDAIRDAMSAVAPPVVDTTGPADAARLAQIHLDPPLPLPARGIGRWLTADAPRALPALFNAARVGRRDGLGMIELRHVASGAAVRPGARTSAPGSFLLHAVGLGDREHLPSTQAALHRVEHAAEAADTGLDASSFREGDPDAGRLDSAVTARLATISARLDPDHTFRFERVC